MRANGARPATLGWKDLTLIGVAASFWPLSVIADNVASVTHIERPLTLIVLVWALAVGVAWVVIRMGAPRLPTVHTVFIAVVILTVGGRLVRNLGALPGLLVLLALLVLAAFVFGRMEETPAARASIIGLAFALAAGPIIGLADSLGNYGTNSVVRTDISPVDLVHSPDIFLVVLDGYPGLQALRQDSVGDPKALVSNLRSEGFQIPNSAWTAYWSTRLSVPSLLDMGYPVVEDPGGGATTSALSSIVGGNSALLATMRSNQYRTTMIESGWSGGVCGSIYDRCVASHWFDETVALILNDAVVGPWLIRHFGSPFTTSTENTMSWLLENAADLSASPQPDFVFAHLIAPHPPFYLNSSCDRVISKNRSGGVFNVPGVTRSERYGYFVEQLECVNDFMLRLAAAVEPDDVIVFVGDHGMDSRYQLWRDTDEWGADGVTERMNVMLAVRTGNGCVIADQIMVPNVMRQVLACHSELPPPNLEARMWGSAMVELIVTEVLSSELTG